MTCRLRDTGSARRVADVLLRGGIAVIPTDTVYGISGAVFADGTRRLAVEQRIRDAKCRPQERPFIRLIANPQDMCRYAGCDVPQGLLSLWPGALSLIVPLAGEPGVTAAFRCPGNDWLRDIIGQVGMPVFSTSANVSGSPVLETERQLLGTLEPRVDLVVLDGDRKGGVPSTVAAVNPNGTVSIVRPGAVTLPAGLCS